MASDRGSETLSVPDQQRGQEKAESLLPPSADAIASSSSSGSCGRTHKEALCRRNIRMMFAFQALNALAWGIAMGPVFDKFLYYLGGGAAIGPTFAPRHARNSLVGITESVSGLASLVIAVPVGLLVDAFPTRRARLLKLSMILAVISSALAILACITDIVLLLYAALIALGIFAEISSSTSEALFADSIPAGQRSTLFSTKAIISTVGAACGPLLSVFGLLALGDEWEPAEMKIVIIVGCCIFPISCLPCLAFQDPPAARSTPEPSESSPCASPSDSGMAPASDDATPAGASVSAAASMGNGGDEASPSEVTTSLMERRWGPFRGKHVPIILAFSDFLTCIGAGMTTKFFNLFFIQDMNFSPVAICVLQTGYPLAISVFMKMSQPTAKALGRAQASVLFFSLNVVCLVCLSKVYSLPLLLLMFLVRGGFANSTYPLDRSILMDFTPSSQRGRWNAVESLTSITWSGSAFIGGIFSDTHDYRFTFLITAAVYFAACVAYLPLLGLVPRKEAAAGEAVAGGQEESCAREVALVPEAERSAAEERTA